MAIARFSIGHHGFLQCVCTHLASPLRTECREADFGAERCHSSKLQVFVCQAFSGSYTQSLTNDCSAVSPEAGQICCTIILANPVLPMMHMLWASYTSRSPVCKQCLFTPYDIACQSHSSCTMTVIAQVLDN